MPTRRGGSRTGAGTRRWPVGRCSGGRGDPSNPVAEAVVGTDETADRLRDATAGLRGGVEVDQHAEEAAADLVVRVAGMQAVGEHHRVVAPGVADVTSQPAQGLLLQ